MRRRIFGLKKQYRLNSLLMMMALAATLCADAQPAYKIDLDNLPLTTLDGQPFELRNMQGQPILVTFWATWCRPCLDELEDLSQTLTALPDSFITIVAISDEQLPVIKQFAAENGYPFLFIKVHKQLARLGIYSIPSTYLLDEKGRLKYSVTGSATWSKGKYHKRIQRLH